MSSGNGLTQQTQFSIYMINKPGVLQQVCQRLADARINIIALAMMDSMEHGVLRVVSDDSTAARDVLKQLEVPISETDVLLVPMPNHPGAMADICNRLAAAKCKVSYAYCTAGTKGGRTTGIFKVANTSKAMTTLNKPINKLRDTLPIRMPKSRR
ncbi:MAG: hypothetical protein HJJLKODD_00367 [Phycisphaerae bacterium]|nr:hypothetical protein [Phycisphaerae bacterium]